MDSLGVFVPGQTVTVAFASAAAPTGGAGNTQISLNGAGFVDLPDPQLIGAGHYSLLVGGNFISVPGFALIRVATGGGDVSLAMSLQPGATFVAQNTQRLVSTLLDDQSRANAKALHAEVAGVTKNILHPILTALGQKKISDETK